MIKKIKGTYVVRSEATGRSFGTYTTLAETKRRLGQIEFFKRMKKNPSLAKKLSKPSPGRKLSSYIYVQN